MEITLEVLGLIFNFVGAFVLILGSPFVKWHQKNHANHWTKRYWWEGWRPIFKVRPPNEK